MNKRKSFFQTLMELEDKELLIEYKRLERENIILNDQLKWKDEMLQKSEEDFKRLFEISQDIAERLFQCQNEKEVMRSILESDNFDLKTKVDSLNSILAE